MDVFGIDVGGSGIKGAPVDTETGTLPGAHPRKDPQACDTRGHRRDDGGCGQEIRLGRPGRVRLSGDDQPIAPSCLSNEMPSHSPHRLAMRPSSNQSTSIPANSMRLPVGAIPP
jgi:hypothetical protein